MTQPHADRIFALAERDAEAGNWDSARAGYLKVLEVSPAHAGAMLQLSYAESIAGRYRCAREWALRSSRLDLPAGPEAMLELIRRLRTFNEAQALHDVADRLLSDARVPARVLVEAARQLAILNDPGVALRCAEAALRKAPGSPDARLARGQLLAHHGRMDAAAEDFEHVLRRNPGFANGWWMLSRLRRQTATSNHVAQLRSLLRAPGIRPDAVAALARALHKELDDLGDIEGAWQALEAMCRARRASLRYDPGRPRRLVDALIAWSGGATQGARAPEGKHGQVFILGMHRSGTTLLEQLLDASPEVRGLGELNDFSAAMRFATDHYSKEVLDLAIVERARHVDFAEVGRRYIDAVAWRMGDERFFTDKQPANFLNIGFICRALPEAKILHLVRDPVETCFSNLRELYSGINEHSYDQRELADYYLQYRRLMAHWHAAFPGRILDVRYRDLTSAPAETMRTVAAWCGIEYLPGMSDTRSSSRVVSTASSVQVRERVASRDAPKWAPYARHLQPLVRALRDGGVEAGLEDAGGP